MREIKFRAWDEQNKTMHFDFQFIKSGDSGNDWIIFKSDKHECFDRWVNNPYFSQQLKIMQFTGINDYNGKEIYEGDLIRSYDSEGNKIINIISFEDGLCRWNVNEGWVQNFEKEVIGNIYENPELIK